MTVRLVPGDCLEEIPRLVAEGLIVDAIVTDPPYHLGPVKQGSVGKSFDPSNRGQTSSPFVGHGGFMGQTWDGGDIAFRPETWATIATALRPGGYLLAFGGTRTHHRIWSAIEDAGFVIQDTILDVVASDTRINAFMDSLSDEQRGAFAQAISEIPMLSWKYGSGFPKGRTQLKPSFEPICVAYKPGGKRTLQIDESRVPMSFPDADTIANMGGYGRATHKREVGNSLNLSINPMPCQDSAPHESGRWPANVCHSGDDEVMEAFAAFGEKDSRPVRPENIGKSGCGERRGLFGNTSIVQSGFYDTGTAARFFYCAKADGEDRWGSKHPTVKPVELISWLVKLVTPPQGLVLDPFAGSGTTAVAAMATGRNSILIERDETYCVDIRERIAHYEGEGRHSGVAKSRNRQSSVAMPLFEMPARPETAEETVFYRCDDCGIRKHISDLKSGCPQCGQTMVPDCL